MTPAQLQHEAKIDDAHQRLITAANRADKTKYWQQLVQGIETRDPEITEQLELARLKRVGL